MECIYLKSEKLRYTSRNRFSDISLNDETITVVGQEVQKSVLLGDGANTTVKTKASNICDYVLINNTRWFVTEYRYFNSAQVTLYLQRDVVGEFGLSSCFGKIERGFTDNILKYRKELSLNQVLKERKYLIPNNFTYGNATVDTHLNEMWGILYLVKPTGIDPATGQPYPEKVNINIPAFAPKTVDYDYVKNGTVTTYKSEQNMKIILNIAFPLDTKRYKLSIFIYPKDNSVNVWFEEISRFKPYHILVRGDRTISNEDKSGIARALGEAIGMAVLNNQSSTDVALKIPPQVTINDFDKDYSNIVIKNGEQFYSYNIEDRTNVLYGQTGSKYFLINNTIKNLVDNRQLVYFVGYERHYITLDLGYPAMTTSSEEELKIESSTTVGQKVYNTVLLTGATSGGIIIDTTEQLVDEPFIGLVFPLFTTNLNVKGHNYTIKKDEAFMIFNTVVQYLSGGTNPYLIDAQVYPYCPTITGVSTELNNYPFLSIASNTYTHFCNVNLLPYLDVKKEYIEREYSIISPEQSGRQTFNFYDYVNNFEESSISGRNGAVMTIAVKTALKPYAIISSAVIQPSINSLKGITYESDLRGCQPSSNGFEVSLSSNAFETYKRQNSNYQQIFALQQEELTRNQAVERVNEKAGAVLNTMNATAMGAIAGGSVGSGIPLPGAKAIGAGAGGVAAGAIVGGLSAYQYSENEKLRQYEVSLQQQRFDLDIGTIKNLPNTINRISSFNEIILRDFWYVIEVYECTEEEKAIVDNFIENYAYSIGVYDFIENYKNNGWFLKAEVITSNYSVNLHEILKNELKGGVYIYD